MARKKQQELQKAKDFIVPSEITLSLPKDLNSAFDLNSAPKSVLEVQFKGTNQTNKVFPIPSEVQNQELEVSSSQENEIATLEALKMQDQKKIINLDRAQKKRAYKAAKRVQQQQLKLVRK